MKIGVVNSYGLNIAKSAQVSRPLNLSGSEKISFTSKPDSFEKGSTGLSVAELLKKHDELIDRIQPEVMAQKPKRLEITSKAREIEKKFDLAHDDDLYNFGILQNEVMEGNALEPVAKAYEEFENTRAMRSIYNFEHVGDKAKESLWGADGGYFLFKSKDKQLADDVASLYPFFCKASKTQYVAKDSAPVFGDTYLKGYYFDGREISLPKKGSQDAQTIKEVQEKLIGVLDGICDSDFKDLEHKRPQIIVMNDIQTFIDTAKNTPEKISEMKYILNNSISEYGTIFLAGTSDPYAETIEKGTIHRNRLIGTVDLDEFGVTREQVDYLKKFKEAMSPEVDKITEVYKTLDFEDRQKMRNIESLFLDYFETNIYLQDSCEDKAALKNLERILCAESSKLQMGDEVESFTKTSPDLVAILKKGPAEAAATEVLKEGTNVVEVEEVKAASAEVTKKGFLNKLKELPKSKLIAFGAAAAAIGAYALIIVKKRSELEKENSKQQQ